MTTSYQRSVLNSTHPAQISPRFWPKVTIAGETDCWEWSAFCNGRGYGMLRVGGKMELAHRVSWVLHFGPIDASAPQVLHLCDNPPCVNPAHLFLGTNAMNMADKKAKGRSHVPQPKKRGEGHPLAKLSWDDVRAIRAAWTGARGQGRAMAAQYGVSPATITNVLKGRVWRDGGPRDPGAGPASPASRGAPDGVRP